MGWARTLFLGDIGNRLDIGDAEQDIRKIRMKLSSQRTLDSRQDKAIAQLQKENEELQLCVAALVTTLERKGVLSTGEVTKLVEMIESDPGEE
jgi:hypothetical protein